MKTLCGICLTLMLCWSAILELLAQTDSAGIGEVPLVLTGAIPLPNVAGRIDHFAFDFHNRLFVSALGNNTEEVIDLTQGRRIHTISGIPSPQGVVYAPELNRLFVASSQGKLFIYDGTTFHLLGALDFHGDADNVRYDGVAKRVYIGYGDNDRAAIGMIDATTDHRLAQDFKLGAHPESFQLETSGPNIFVNLPDLSQIAVINRQTGAIARWSLTLGGNFPMALDEPNHRLFVATRSPARLAVFDTHSGQMLASLPCVQDADDLYYDPARRRIYVTGGEGYVSVFSQEEGNRYQLLSRIPSSLGARTSGYFGRIGKKGFDRFYVAVPARADHGAEIWIYTVQD